MADKRREKLRWRRWAGGGFVPKPRSTTPLSALAVGAFCRRRRHSRASLATVHGEPRYAHSRLAGTNTNEGNLFLRRYQPTDTGSFNAWVNEAFAPCGKQVLALYDARYAGNS